MGRGKYTLIYGMLLWGIPTAILWALAMSAVQGWDRLPVLLVLALDRLSDRRYFLWAIDVEDF